ncbi:MAG: DSBA-like thioredoxin, partial [Ilumatobacteraceae bacterium]|nr:DSBA-like thioredoxin [Ilumatobacteraceae bacterium]
MKVEFWFDPVCPFCWMTSRWLVDVAAERDLDIDWRPISLLFKNDTQPDSPWYAPVSRTRDLLRVVE